MPLFAAVSISSMITELCALITKIIQCLADIKSCKQTNIPIYSFSEHQRLDETKYLYGAAVIISAFRRALVSAYTKPRLHS